MPLKLHIADVVTNPRRPSRAGNIGGMRVNATEIVNRYVGDLVRVLQAIDSREIEQVIAALDTARVARARVFVVGNGGSAATAAHLCTDLSVGLRRRGLVGFDIQCLSDNAAIATAVSNDLSYDEVFSAQLEGVIRRDDVLVAISASGSSPNIVRAVKCAKRAHATVIGISGFDGGDLRREADVSFHVPTTEGAYGLVEDAHLVLNHILHSWYAVEASQLEDRNTAEGAGPRARVPGRVASERGWVRLGRPKRRGKWQPPTDAPG